MAAMLRALPAVVGARAASAPLGFDAARAQSFFLDRLSRAQEMRPAAAAVAGGYWDDN